MEDITHCLLTGYKLSAPATVSDSTVVYKSRTAGFVHVSLAVVLDLQQKKDHREPVLAGFCKNAEMRNVDPPFISTDFYNTFESLPYPKTFAAKAKHLLTLLYDNGGNEFKAVTIFPYLDYASCFAEDSEEFERVMVLLEKQGFIEWSNRTKLDGRYIDVLLTIAGIEEVQKGLPKMPMIGLVAQSITTGDKTIDEKINHAKKLFFDDPKTIENMRSACVALAAVLEPIRYQLTPAITSADVEDFFQLVNKFEIRHNKNVATLKHPEQLEWVFYSLLNTINVYYKLKIKLT